MATSGFASAFGGGLATKLGLAGHTLAGKVVAGMGSAGLTALSSQAAIALVSEKGDIAKAAKSLIKKDALKSLGVAVAVAGLTAGLADALDVDLDPTKLAEHPNRVMAHAQANLVKAVAKGAVKVAAGDKIEDVLKDGAVDVAAGVAGGVAANHIGEAYGEGNLDPLTHKAAHAALGAGLGALQNPDDLKAAILTGATAGALSEIWAEVFAKDIEDVAHQTVAITDDEDEAQSIMKDWIDRQADMAKLVTVAMAGALGQDVALAEQIADNALKNNFGPTLRIVAQLIASAAAKKAGQEGVKKGAQEAVKKQAKDVAKKEAKEEAKRQVKEQVEDAALLEKPKMIKHHIFNKFRGNSEKSQKYRDFFKEHQIDVDKYCVEIPDTMHKNKIHTATNNWTTKWKNWIDVNPSASTKDVYQFAGQLMDEYGLSHVPLQKY